MGSTISSERDVEVVFEIQPNLTTGVDAIVRVHRVSHPYSVLRGDRVNCETSSELHAESFEEPISRATRAGSGLPIGQLTIVSQDAGHYGMFYVQASGPDLVGIRQTVALDGGVEGLPIQWGHD